MRTTRHVPGLRVLPIVVAGGRAGGALLAGCLTVIFVLVICGCRGQGEPNPKPQAARTDNSPAHELDPQANEATPAIQGIAATSPPGQRAGTAVQAVLRDPGDQTDNSACLVCHIDFEDEPIAAKHLEAEIVCAACHGASEAHRSDELNIITPDVTFGRSEIDVFCKRCHPTHKTGEVYDAFVKQWYGKRRPNGRMVLENSVCTDCHGDHAILRPDQQIAR